MLPPSSVLPHIKRTATHSTESLQSAVTYLRSIYNPLVRGSRRRKRETPPLASTSTSRDTNTSAEDLRTDAFERVYAIKWLTALVAQCEMTDEGEEVRQSLVEEAASLLATCAGTASAGVITRQFVFDMANHSSSLSQEPQSPIAIDITDVPLDNHDYGSVGAQTWGGACVMAEMIAEQPEAFGLPREFKSGRIMRCLELGAGTGLVSLTVGKLIERVALKADAKYLNVDVVATDYYPSVLANLERNIHANFRTPNPAVRISSCRLDWSTFFDVEVHEPVFSAPFDVVYGADIIYEALHASWIKACLTKLLRKPSPDAEDPLFHLIIPLRATHAVESGTIETVFNGHESSSGSELELVIKHKDVIVCDVEGGGEIEYAYYKIGWDLS